MKSIVFSTDVLIGVSIALLLLSLIPLTFESKHAESSFQALSYQADDLMNVLATLTTNDIRNEPTVQNLINSGILTDKDLNKTVLDLIGTFWYSGNESIAANITRETLENLTDKCFKLETESENIYSSCSSTSDSVAVAFRTASGYEIGKPIAGYVARAWASKVKKNNTLIVKGDVISSSVSRIFWFWVVDNNNKVNVTYDLNIPESANLIDSEWFIEASWTSTGFDAYINGNYIGSGIGYAEFKHLNSYLHTGHNSLLVIYSYGTGGHEGGDDGSSHFILNYSIEKKQTLPISDKYYFSTVRSKCSIRYKKPIIVPGEVKNLSVNLTLTGSTATLKFVFEGQTYDISKKNVVNNNVYWSDSEIRSALNSNGIYYSNLSSKYFWFVVYVDDYHEFENQGSLREILNTSYVWVNATYSNLIYGYIDITRVVPLYSYSDNAGWDDFYKNVEWRFNSSGVPLLVDSQFPWLYYSGSDPTQKITANSITLYEHPPQPLVTELARFGYTNTSGEIMTGENSYALTFSQGYGINPFNSLVDYTHLLPSLVGYGDVFNSSELAVEDAKNRLESLWVGEDISPESITVENRSVYGVQWLWGPSLFKLYLW